MKEGASVEDGLSNDELIGIAFPISGVGFWNLISGYFAVTPDGSKAIGVVFIQQGETPGLGGRITEQPWRKQFQGLNIAPPEGGGKFIYIGSAAPGAAQASGRSVNAITGATQTSVAVENFLNADLARFHRAMAAAGGAGK
jgi:Na+-transporting NADH:ubiquinone oxidoreductase subunit C